jgi:hypothetical protein
MPQGHETGPWRGSDDALNRVEGSKTLLFAPFGPFWRLGGLTKLCAAELTAVMRLGCSR